jgi:hypothetical protein
MPLKELVLCLNRTLWGQFLREICPLKKMTTKYNAASGIIAGELLRGGMKRKRRNPQTKRRERGRGPARTIVISKTYHWDGQTLCL